jgi:hypothetical protein
MDIQYFGGYFQIFTNNGTFTATGTGVNVAINLNNITYAIFETDGAGAQVDNIDFII